VQESETTDSSRTMSRYRGGAGAVTQPPPPAQPPPPPPVITLQYLGSHLDLTHRWLDPRDEVIIEQQHCGGNTVYVYRERITPGSALCLASTSLTAQSAMFVKKL